jgi:spore photoproduct lyase
MLRSANYLLFVNYEDFLNDIKLVVDEHANDEKPAWFFSGYDCDSLAYEPVTKFAEFFVPAFKQFDNAVLELRTKSTQIRSLLNIEPQHNVVVAYSLSPERVAKELEKGAPSLKKRIEAMQKLQKAGWRIGLRFDPIIWHADYLADYKEAVTQVFDALDPSRIDSVTLGGFRLPKGFYKAMYRLHPEHWLFNSGLSEEDGMVIYRKEIEAEAIDTVRQYCEQFISPESIYAYHSYE